MSLHSHHELVPVVSHDENNNCTGSTLAACLRSGGGGNHQGARLQGPAGPPGGGDRAIGNDREPGPRDDGAAGSKYHSKRGLVDDDHARPRAELLQ